MTNPTITLNRLRNCFTVCHDCGTLYGKPRHGEDCPQWHSACGVCGRLKPCTDVRNYGYLYKGRRELGEK